MRELQAAGGTALNGNQVASDRPAEMTAPDLPGPPAPHRRRIALLLAVAAAVLVTDIVTKVVVVATLSHHAPVRLLGGFLTLRVTRNPGAAFSIGGPSTTAVFALIALGVIVFILRTSRRIQSLAWTVTLGLLLGGATGNLTDRIFRWPGPFRGWVVDWIQWPHWPVFNIADSCIVCGGVLAVFLAVRGVRIDGPIPAQAGPGDGQPADSQRPDSQHPDSQDRGSQHPGEPDSGDQPPGGPPGDGRA